MPTLGVQSCFLCKAWWERQRPTASHLAFVSKFCLSTFTFVSGGGGKHFLNPKALWGQQKLQGRQTPPWSQTSPVDRVLSNNQNHNQICEAAISWIMQSMFTI